jgi:hypothetical protein
MKRKIFLLFLSNWKISRFFFTDFFGGYGEPAPPTTQSISLLCFRTLNAMLFFPVHGKFLGGKWFFLFPFPLFVLHFIYLFFVCFFGWGKSGGVFLLGFEKIGEKWSLLFFLGFSEVFLNNGFSVEFLKIVFFFHLLQILINFWKIMGFSQIFIKSWIQIDRSNHGNINIKGQGVSIISKSALEK